jgi:predicted nucleotide-binding protein
MIGRFQGEEGTRRLIESVQGQRFVENRQDLASRLVEVGELIEVANGDAFIHQGAEDNDVFLIIAGAAQVVVNGVAIANRFSGDHVGEMSVIETSRSRTATVSARELTVLLKVSEPDFSQVAKDYPSVWRHFAAALARRLAERVAMITAPRERVKVFIISSVEALHIVDLLIQEFEYDEFLPVVWRRGVFKASHYTLDDLEEQLDDADFAIAVAHADDMVVTRDDEWPTMRDNVVFELGLFMGRLGRRRAFLMEPRDINLRLPSDLAGLTTVPYRYEKGRDAAALIAPACAKLRALINDAGVRR